MLEFVGLAEKVLQYIIIVGFILLSITGAIKQDWNYGFGLNLSLVGLYVFLYLKPLH